MSIGLTKPQHRSFASSTGEDFEIQPPAKWLTWTEPVRALSEFYGLFARLPKLASAPRGDGHTVLVLPGFATSDIMTEPLRRYLAYIGYRSEPWGLGFNTGYRKLGEGDVRLHQRLEELFAQSKRKVSLVGWSLGGVMARRLARERPDMIRQVITLGSPFTGNLRAVTIRRFYELVSGERLGSEEARRRFERDQAAPSQVRSTAIFSRHDGITAWENCIEQESELASNIEVRASHLGLPANAEVFLAVADLLKKPEQADQVA